MRSLLFARVKMLHHRGANHGLSNAGYEPVSVHTFTLRMRVRKISPRRKCREQNDSVCWLFCYILSRAVLQRSVSGGIHQFIMFHCTPPYAVSDYCPSTRYLTDPVVHGSLPTLVYDVAVSNYLPVYPAEEIFSFSSPFDIYCWCSGTNILPQNITIDFTGPLIIHGMLLGGYGIGSSTRSYVTAFSLEYSETHNSDVIVDHLPKVKTTTI